MHEASETVPTTGVPLPRRRELRQHASARRRTHRPRHRVEPVRRSPGQAAIRVGAPITAAGLVAGSLLAPAAAAGVGAVRAAAAVTGPVQAGSTRSEAASGAGQPEGSSVAATAIGYAMAMLGKPYVWGGSDPAAGFDCSGLVLSAYRYAGLALPRTASAQYLSAIGTRLPLAHAQPGDLVFWGTDVRSGGSVYHVAMYASPGMVISAPSTGSVVQIQRMWTRQLMPDVVRPAPSAAGLLPVRPGSSGWSVTDLQHRLRNNGYAVRVTGVFDQQTLHAVQALQAALGVVRDPVSPSAAPAPAARPTALPPATGPTPSSAGPSPSVSLQSVAGVTVIAVEGADPQPAGVTPNPAAAATAVTTPSTAVPGTARPPLPPLPPLSATPAPGNPGATDLSATQPPATQPPVAQPTASSVPGEVGPQTWQWLVGHGNRTGVS